MRKLFYLIAFTIFVSSFWACDDKDDFSSDSGLRLTFSSDTIRFDTVFSTIGSAAMQLRVYNNNNNSVTISSIELMNPTKSGFRINVDGESGTVFSNIDILKKDSLFTFIKVTVNPLDTGTPLVIRDSIRFVTNGNIQYVQLEAIGQDVHIWRGRVIASDSILTNDKPFLIYDSLVISKGATVTIEKGIRFFFRRNASMQIYGTLHAQGSISERIIFRGDRFDDIEAGIPYDNVSGQWGGIFFHPQSFDNHLENVFIRNSTKGVTFLASDPEYKKATLINVIVHNTSDYGVLAINCNIDGKNCLFTNSGGAALKLVGGKYSFLHSTIANYYRWSTRRAEALIVSNIENISKVFPLMQCDITNSIVYGSATQELLLESVQTVPFVYRFRNCLIKAPVNDNPFFVNTIWNADPKFRDLNSTGTFSYNFELQSGSPAIGAADKNASLLAPYDLNGKSRLGDSNPDIGCYEWIANE